MRLPSTERSRPYAIGMLAMALALVYLIGLHWWWTAPMLAMGDRIEDLRAQELDMRTRVEQRPEIEKRLADVRRIEAANPGFLPEATVELAQAGLVQRMESQIGAVSPDHGACTISQRTPTPWAGPAERYQRVVVQVRLLCGMTEFSALLHAFESGRPQLFVANLNIISRSGFNPDPAAAAASAPLDIGFDLYGYLRPGTTHAP
jgi:general secretion pathway protein M